MMPIDDPYSRLDAELASARKRIAELETTLNEAREYTLDIRRRFGALDSETLFAFVARLVRERDAAKENEETAVAEGLRTFAEFGKRIRELEDAGSADRDRAGRLAAKNSELETRTVSWGGRIDELEAELATARKRIAELEANALAAELQRARLVRERDEALSDVRSGIAEAKASGRYIQQVVRERDDAQDELARMRSAEPAVRADSAAVRDAEEQAATARKAANALADQNAEMRALLTEALRRHDETPLGEWARTARNLVGWLP